MKHQAKEQFSKEAPELAPLSMGAAIMAAREAIESMSGLPVDAVAQCHRADSGGWAISIDVIESPALLGDNDLLSTYDIVIGRDAEVASFNRTRRYHREDGSG